MKNLDVVLDDPVTSLLACYTQKGKPDSLLQWRLD